MKKKVYSIIKLAVVVVLLNMVAIFSRITPADASNGKIEIGSTAYIFDEKGKYEIDGASPVTLDRECNVGKLNISGDLSDMTSNRGVPSYKVGKGNVSFSYVIDYSVLNRTKDEWTILSDKSNEVNGIKLEKDILNGAIIVQTSMDGSHWITNRYFTDIIKLYGGLQDNFFNTTDIQIQNGCFYRVLVVYKMQRRISEKKFPFAPTDKYEKREIATVYQFYLESSETTISASSTPRKELGSVVNTGKDNGYAQSNSLKYDDPHYGWTIGTFFVNGYTEEVKDENGQYVFLKKVGDKVTLWFNLKQDINRLNGNSDYIINEDTNGYDVYFQTGKTNIKHGAMIIRYTDYQGVKHDPIIYTDYLAANARMGADTKVQLFEEGDYEVALDYEIKNKKPLIDEVTNYRIYFTFSIRNGNCMAFPFDIATNTELHNMSITENGFRLDLAKSRYLNIIVERAVLVQNADGITAEDTRFNHSAKDGDVYTEEGIYTIKVKNLYTREDTSKVIYVGENKVLKALSLNKMSIEELNQRISEGATIETDGTIKEPVIEEPVIEPSIELPEESVNGNNAEKSKDDNKDNETVSDEEKDSDSKGRNVIPFVIIAVLLTCCGGVIYFVMSAKKKHKVTEEFITSEEDGNFAGVILKTDEEKNTDIKEEEKQGDDENIAITEDKES